jgi:hypothetical protein
MGNFTSKKANPAAVSTPTHITRETRDISQQFIYVEGSPKPKKAKLSDTKHYLAELRSSEKEANAHKKQSATQRTNYNTFTRNASESNHVEIPSRIIKNPVKSGLTSKAAMFQHAPKAHTEAERISAGVERRSTFK